MAEAKGFTSGFDYLRLALSLGVLIWHSYVFTHDQASIENVLQGPAGLLIYLILPMFFALSGFLVASSLIRVQKLSIFLWLRFVRLFPALAVEVILSSLILGPLATTLDLRDYFSHPSFWSYFTNLVGIVQLQLPGVFANNPAAYIVNGSLWTVPYELECYIALGILCVVKLVKHPKMLGLLFILVILGKTFVNSYNGVAALPLDHLPGRQLIPLFICGIVIYLNRDFIPKNGPLAIIALVVGGAFIRNPSLYLLAMLPLAYATVHLGLLNPARNKIVLNGDYSYGIYLYAAPIQQAAYHFTDWGKTYAGNICIATCLTLSFAAFSWHAIEKPALKFKKLFIRSAASPSVRTAGVNGS